MTERIGDGWHLLKPERPGARPQLILRKHRNRIDMKAARIAARNSGMEGRTDNRNG